MAGPDPGENFRPQQCTLARRGATSGGGPGTDLVPWSQGAAKVLILPVVQQFTEAFVQALQVPDGPTADSGFKMEVLKVSASSRCTPGVRGRPATPNIPPSVGPVLCDPAGRDRPGEELPQAHGGLHAADPAHRLEHPDRERGLISFPGREGLA